MTQAISRSDTLKQARKLLTEGKSKGETAAWISKESGYISDRSGKPLSLGGAYAFLSNGRLRKRRTKGRKPNKTRIKARVEHGQPRRGGSSFQRLINAITGTNLKDSDKLALIALVSDVHGE